MELETFLHHLHFDPEKIAPPDWEVDWEDAPLAYKLYRGLPEVPLPANVPITFKGRETHGKPNLEELGQFLWFVYGLSQYSQIAYPLGDHGKSSEVCAAFKALCSLWRGFVSQ